MDELEIAKAEKARITDFHAVFGSDIGKRVLSEMIQSYMMRSSHVANDPYSTAFNEGARSVVVDILKTLQIDASKYFDMIREGNYEF